MELLRIIRELTITQPLQGATVERTRRRDTPGGIVFFTDHLLMIVFYRSFVNDRFLPIIC